MKTTIKIALLISLFSTAALAEGEMGNGGRTCPNETTTCLTGNNTTDGGTTTTGQTSQDESILTFIKEYLDSLFGSSDPE